MTRLEGPVAVIGGNGQLGSDLMAALRHQGYDGRALTHADIKVEDATSVQTTLQAIRPAVIVNCAAFHVVPKCEERPDEAWRVNALGALNVARAAAELDAVNVYVSTDYVFDGGQQTPYAETQRPNPLNVYGVTKLSGEYFVLQTSSRGVVIRVSGIYGAVPSRAKGGNFITTMIKAAKERAEVRVVDDEVLAPTPTREIANGIIELLKLNGSGLFHMSCDGEASWYQFAKVIFSELGITTPLVPASVKDFPSSVRRPHYSVLSNETVRALGVPKLPHWKEAVVGFLRTHKG